mgnify:CR=1 FL=1
MSEKLSAKQYAEQLLYKPEYAADKQPDVKEKAAAFAEGYKNYKAFLNAAKTEREAAAASEKLLLEAGYEKFEPKKTYAPGEKIYFIQEHKAVVAATIGQKPFEEGFRLVIAHIDSPRLDLRPNPLYEANHLSYFKTHYYGGIRRWPSTACLPVPTAPACPSAWARTRTIPSSASLTCCPIWVPSRTTAS